MKPCKIVYLLDTLVHERAGTEGQLLQLVARLDRTRYDPAVAVLRDSEPVAQDALPFPVRVLDIPKLASPRALVRMTRFALELRRRGYALVHCFLNDASILAPPLMRLAGLRVVVSRRDMGFWYTPAVLLALRAVVPCVDRYVANSVAVRRNVERRERVPARKLTVIHNGYEAGGGDDVRRSPLSSLPRGVPVVGVVANLRPIKRLDTLVEAFAHVGERFADARLVIVGDDASAPAASLRERLERLASDLAISDRVIFAGSTTAPRAFVERFDVAVLCSESEGFSNAIIEYLACGRPVVCTDTGGNAELVDDGRNGFLVPVGDSRALADRIVRLLSDTALRARLGDAARRTAARFSGARMAQETMACYDALLDRTPRGDAAPPARTRTLRRASDASARSSGP